MCLRRKLVALTQVYRVGIYRLYIDWENRSLEAVLKEFQQRDRPQGPPLISGPDLDSENTDFKLDPDN